MLVFDFGFGVGFGVVGRMLYVCGVVVFCIFLLCLGFEGCRIVIEWEDIFEVLWFLGW